MDKTTGCDILFQVTGGTLGAGTMAGMHESVLLGVFGQSPGILPSVGPELLEVACMVPALAHWVWPIWQLLTFVHLFAVCILGEG